MVIDFTPKIRPNGLPHYGTITVLQMPVAGDYVTVGGVTYTFGTNFFGKTEYEVAANLACALNGDPATYGHLHTVANYERPYWALVFGTVVYVYSSTPGTAPSIALTTSIATRLAVSGASLSGGSDACTQFRFIEPTLVVTASSAYTADDVVGTKVELTGLPRGVMLQSVLCWDLADQAAAMRLFFFKQEPTLGTYTDHGALVLTGDETKCQAIVDIAAANWTSAVVTGSAYAEKLYLGHILQPAASSLWLVCQTKGTPTYATTADLKIRLGFFVG